MKTNELRTMANAELATKLDEAYQELFNLRFQKATGKLTNTGRRGQVRKDIARIKTVLRERELAEL
ncbi:MAG: 50S ribosomal protein L29 [Caldilineaceae bacterium]